MAWQRLFMMQMAERISGNLACKGRPRVAESLIDICGELKMVVHLFRLNTWVFVTMATLRQYLYTRVLMPSVV